MTTSETFDERFYSVPEETLELIRRFRATHDPALVTPIVQAIVRRYVGEATNPAGGENGSLAHTLGLESLSLVEVILDLQDALGITIHDEELRNLKSFEEATALVVRKAEELRTNNAAP